MHVQATQLKRGLLVLTLTSTSCSGTSTGSPAQPSPESIRAVITRLDLESYKANISGLTQFGDREQGTSRNRDALDWIETRLKSYGYSNVERHRYSYRGLGMTEPEPRDNIYATKLGTSAPHEMYIVSAHLDGRGGGEAANDDASGTALVLELARVLGTADIKTARSVRFILWNNGETGLDGSKAYVQERASLQGVETPTGSKRFPEPKWLAVVHHDMLLFDHGLPPSREQSPTADIDVEYQASSARAQEAAALAALLLAANQSFASDYPAEVGRNMTDTDSRSFQDLVASVSLRENQRTTEISRGSNPHLHRPSDVYSTYSDDDFRLGFNAAQTTLGAVAQLAGVHIRRR